MLRTISLGSCVSVQGLMVGQQADGRIIVRVDETSYVGYPIASARHTTAQVPAATPA